MLLRRVALWFALAGGLIASIVALNTVVSVIARATISKPIPGDVELTQFGIALAISLCLPWCQLHGANIIVDFFTQKLLAASPARCSTRSAHCCWPPCARCWRGAPRWARWRCSEAGETSMILGLPMWWTYASLAPGLALTALVALVQAAGLLRSRPLLAESP